MLIDYWLIVILLIWVVIDWLSFWYQKTKQKRKKDSQVLITQYIDILLLWQSIF